MKDVYIVTSGEYSDYKIDAVFDSKELAQKYIDSLDDNGYYDYDIETWELNPEEEKLKKGYKCYYVSMDKNGNVNEVRQSSYNYGDRPSFRKDKKSFYAILLARDETHAIKILNEKRIIALANNTWGDNRYTL